MLKSITTKLINKFLKEYIIIDEDKNLLVQSWNGNVNLKKIELVQKYYHNFSVRGMIEDLRLVIPWNNFLNGYVTIEASNVDIYIAFYDVQQNLSKLAVNNSESISSDDKKEKKKMSFFLRKLLEKLLIKVENLTIYYRKYRLKVNMISINDKKEINIESISLEMNSNETYIKKIMPFDFRGKISDNSINAYVDCVDVLVRRRDIVEITCDMLDLYKEILQVSKEHDEMYKVASSKRDVDASEKELHGDHLLPKIDGENKIEQELEGDTKRIINLDEEIKICLVMDKLKLKIIKETRKGLIKVLKYRILDLKLEHRNSTNLNFRLDSSTVRLFYNMENDRITVSEIYVNTIKIMKRLGYRLRNKLDLTVSCSEIGIDKKRCALKGFRLKGKDVCFEIPFFWMHSAAELIFTKISEINISADVCKLLMFVKTHIELTKGNRFLKKITNRLGTRSDTKMPWVIFCLQSCILNTSLFVGNFSVIPGCIDKNIEELEQLVTGGKQLISDDTQGYVIKSDTIRWYEHEKHDICVTLVDSAVPISRFHFGNFTVDEIKKCTNGYCVGRVQYKKTQLDNFVITFEDIIKVEIDKIAIHNEYDLVRTIYGIKNVVYSFITDQFSSSTKDPGKDVEICIKKITYYHKSIFEIECLLFKNDTLTLRVFSGGLAVHISLGISDTEVKVDLKVEGAVDTAEYNSILYCIIEFIDILITILDNSYEGKTKSKMVLINADAKMLLRGVVCARSAHCAEECYRLTTSASVVILGENITVTVEKGFLTAINQSTGHSDTLSILNKSFDKNNSIIGESTGLLEHEVVVNDLKVKIKKIEYGMNLDVSVSEIHNSILLHQVLILREYYLLPQLGIIGTALRLNYTIKIGKIRCDLSYNSRVRLDITSLCIENDTTKFDVEYGGINARINIKTTYDVVNTLKISTNNVIVKNEVQDYEMYHKLLQTLLDESNTNFTSGRYTQVNLIVKESELYLNRSKPQDEDTSYFVETMPLLMFQIEKLIFFSPTTGSLRFSGYIFNPKILEYELLFEPASIVVAMLGNKITVKCSDLRLNIAKETFQTFSFDHKDCIIQLENIMNSLGVFFRAGHHEKYDLDVVPDDNDDEHNVCESETRTGNIKSVSGLEHEGHKNENAGSSQARHRRIASESAGPGPVLHQDIFKKKFNALNSHDTKMSDIMVGPLTGAIIHKKFYSKKLDLTVNNQKITIDLTKEEKHHVMNSFVFTKIHNFNRYIRVFNHVYFKNCLPYELDLLLGDDDVQEEELVLKNDLSFNTSHMYLRIRMGNKISADSFMFQKGVYKADDDNVTLFLDERSILIERKVINLLSYVENISGNLVYYVFFLPNSYIVNKTRRNLNICLEGNFFTRELVLEPEEIIAADCWRFKDRIGIKSPIDDFMSVSNAFLSKSQCTQMQAADERIKHDFIISHKSPAEHSSILLTRKKLSISILRNIFRVFNLYVLNFRFTVMNSIDEKIYIDDERLSKGVTERDITRGTVLINNKLRVFDFNVLNILKELEHKYLLSMETRNVTIDVGSKLEIVDQDNVASPHEVQFEQKVVEIKYSYVVENKTGTGLMVNDTFFANNEHKPIEMHKKNVLKINDMHINMIVCPYFRIRDSFYTIITKIREKQKIMRLEASDAPIEIHNNTETVMCVNKKYFLNPGDKLDYVYDNYKELKIDFEANMEGKFIKLKRKYGRTVCADNFKVASMNRGAKEYIYLGETPTNVHFEDVFVILINSLTISLFENNCEFVNLYLRDLEAVKQIDTLKNLFTYAVSIRGMQIDNQYHSPAFPIILSPVYPMFYYYNNTASADDGHFMIYKCEINGNLFHRDERTPDSRTLSFNYIIFAMHEFELSIEEEVLTRLFMWLPKGKGDTALFCTLLHIHPINLRLNLLMSKKKHFIHKLIGFLVSNLSEVRLSFTTLIFSQFEYNNDLLINAYKMQMLSQIFNLIGGLDLLGNLSSLVEELSLGVHDLFYEPYVGLKHDGLFMFTKGILKGGKNFVTYCISGLTSTVGKVGRSISRSSSNKRLLFYDELEIDVTKDLIENVVDGLSGIITKPVKGAKKGVKGFLKGVGSGLKGALMKPIAGISEFAANISDNIKTNMNGAELRRIQYPRYKLEKYNLDLCQAYFLFDIYKNKDMQPIDSGTQRHLKVCNEQFVGGGKGKVYDMKVHVIVTSQRLLMISHQANLHINSFDVVMGGIKVKDWIVELDDETMSYVRTLK